MTGYQESAPLGGFITKVERQARAQQRYNVFIDDKLAFSVHEDIMIKYRLLKGAQVESAEMERILAAEERHKAYLSAVRLLASRLRSEHEMRSRLKEKEFQPDVIEDVISRLRTEGYLNDALFAEQMAKQRSQSQKKGRHWIKQELKQKGVPKEHIETALAGVDAETEREAAYALVSRRYKREWEEDPSKARRKIASFLQRRGYTLTVVQQVLGKMPQRSMDDDDLAELDLSEYE
ncbi:RecX family transcriptional regulator [Paenibacillus validus]|uniref:Regulatory protein RecX n=1 Tax=Paenibacillus validus TaxID=44253 RepID=A0A7X3CSW9_9BACL|nr:MULTISPECIES: RecX family transcriptional regulator [Paenibacillus]MED4601733.1 RecX family transcriptional regulator [Paenibacillus validus]MED4605445.1 RecX family transcriptional regulator [Paenibacillus validus]MUG70452.1 recombinase RecX [Paenibacillus validus]